MELAVFVTDVLTAVMAGVKNAENAAKEYGAVVNPRKTIEEFYNMNAPPLQKTQYTIQSIEFDIALTVERSGTKGGGGNIAVMSIGAGGKVESTTKNSSASHVRFSLPIVLPSVGQLPAE